MRINTTSDKSLVDAPLSGPVSSQVQSLPEFSAREANAPFIDGEVIGERYAFQAEIAEGGMARILAASHLGLDEPVAIKILRPEFLADPALVARFFREAKATARLRNEYIVRVIDVGIDARRGPYIVMERLIGHDGRHLLDRDARISLPRVAEMAIQLCEALSVAHAQGVVHRDLKPENIFFLRQGAGADGQWVESVRLLDFGVAKAVLAGSVFNQEVPMVQTQGLFGSPYYLAPEQVRATTEIGPETDIWSLGVCMYEFLTGTPPFTGESLPAVCAAILEAEVKPLPASVDGDPGALAAFFAVMLRCLDRNVEKRWKNVVELAIALEPFAPPRARGNVDRMIAAEPATSRLRSGSSFPRPPSMPTKRVPTEAQEAHRISSMGLLATQAIPGVATPDEGAVAAPVQAPKRWPYAVGALLAVLLLLLWVQRSRHTAAIEVAPTATAADPHQAARPDSVARPAAAEPATPAAAVTPSSPAPVPATEPVAPSTARPAALVPQAAAGSPRRGPAAALPAAPPAAPVRPSSKAAIVDDKPRAGIVD